MDKLLYKKVMGRGGACRQAPILKAGAVDGKDDGGYATVRLSDFGAVPDYCSVPNTMDARKGLTTLIQPLFQRFL